MDRTHYNGAHIAIPQIGISQVCMSQVYRLVGLLVACGLAKEFLTDASLSPLRIPPILMQH